MNQLFATFGIDWRLLLVNVVNFGLLLFILWRFLYKPLTSMLEKRRELVAQGVEAAQAAQAKLEEIKASRAHALASAGKEADTILSNARRSAGEEGRTIVAQSEDAAASVLKEAELQAKEIKKTAIEESKEEVAQLIVLGMERAMQGARK